MSMLTRIASIAAAVTLVAGLGAAVSSTEETQSAWTDVTYTAVSATAGDWQAPTTNTCQAWKQNGKPTDCTVSAITYQTWNSSGADTKRVRDYTVAFHAPSAKTIEFSVDLSTARWSGGSIEIAPWQWSGSGVGPGSQFSPAAGWTCADLPVVTGTASDWHSNTWIRIIEKSWDTVRCP
ncbi:hypothetical protein ACFQZV_10530 [Microbacterium koreense]|uniref:Secreted protein n=1 Tax=Microbacterium koreense TaxID=323761 RepID=A0ABW2ZSU3_9MICO